MSDRLGTAQWEPQAVVSRRYPFAPGKFWLGRAEDATAIGYRDDRHVCLVSGNRGGKGTSVIVNNLCLWPGSAVVVDPKGENATVTTARRGQGSEYCTGMGQAVHVLDPFKTTDVDERYRSCFNPLAELDPHSDETIDEASRLANAIVVVKDDAREPFFDESARTMVRGLILHVLSSKTFTPDERNLITVRNLIQRGAWEIVEAKREAGEEKIDDPHLLLWRAMELNPAFSGVVAGIGSQFRGMMSSPKTFQGVLQGVANNTEFLDSPGMRRVLSKSDFKLSELKTRPEGMTLYLSLPQRYMDTHYRWLRMMVSLTTTQMEKTRGQPASGHPVLMVLDEFAGLKRMAAIESAVAQIAGFGVKLFFVLQSLEQLKATYKDSWETFLSNAGLKIFFSVEDHFSRDYVSKLAGDTELIREVHSSNESQSENEGRTEGRTESRTVSQSTTHGASTSQTRGMSQSVNQAQTDSRNTGRNMGETSGTNASFGWSNGNSSGVSYAQRSGGTSGYFPQTVHYTDATFSQGENSSVSGSSGTSRGASVGTSEGASFGTSRGATFGSSDGRTDGTSISATDGTSTSTGTSQSTTRGSSRTSGAGRTETVHRRPLVLPDEVGRSFARIDDRNHPAYPGFALVIVTGANPLVVRRAHYFEDVEFIDCFSPHPDHEFRPAATIQLKSIRPLIDALEAGTGGNPLTIAEWFVRPGDRLAAPNQPAARIERVPPDNRPVFIEVPPCIVVSTAATPENLLPSGEYRIPDAPLLTIRSYAANESGLHPLRQLHKARAALEELNRRKPPLFGAPGAKATPGQMMLYLCVMVIIGLVWWVIHLL